MDAQTLKALEDAIKFGQRTRDLDTILGHGLHVLDSELKSDVSKRNIAAQLPTYRQLVQELSDEVQQKYVGIVTAERSITFTKIKLAEFERAAQPYLG